MTSDAGRGPQRSGGRARGFARVVAAMLLTGAWGATAYAADTCAPALARIVSVQGNVDVRRPNTDWKRAELDSTLCVGDMVRVHQRSRAALLLANESTLRLDQGTALTIAPPDAAGTKVLRQDRGAMHILTRARERFKVQTPFVNANVEGTEFLVSVAEQSARIAVFEGRVVADNDAGSVVVASGEQAVASRGAAPSKELAIAPRDAVQWTLYFPTLLDARVLDAASAGDAPLRESIRSYREGRLADAIARLDAVPDADANARLLAFRAALLLAVGRVDEATPAIERAQARDPRSADARALASIVALVRNDSARALALADEAVKLDPASATARLALSYAQQARFDIDAARESVRAAVGIDAGNALAHARLAELELALGNVGAAVAEARRAVELDAHSAKAQAVLGFASLARIDAASARSAFGKAIALDDADPLPRLGLGLAMIRDGDLAAGREQIEVALSLDPDRSLIRSYLGKAYYEEKRDAAATQFAIAKERDPNDPTPWFYDAILKYTQNRPVEALDDLQRSIELNGNRSVYRSRLQIDQDQAERGVTQARIYTDIGFDRLALNAGTASLAADPSNSAAHRLLADAYVDMPRHEIARVSELLQSQLRQPLTMTPTQLQLGEQRFVALRGAGPSQAGLNEFNALFNRNGIGLQASGIVGGNSTTGDELLLSGIQGRFGYSVGQLAYHTDGFRENNDYRNRIYDAFVQYQANEALGVQAEVRRSEAGFGDTVLRFDPELFAPDRNQLDSTSYRVGARYRFGPQSELIGSAIAIDSRYTNGQFDTTIVEQDLRTYIGEIQHTWRDRAFDLITGAGAYSEKTKIAFFEFRSDSRPHAANAYVYGNLRAPGDALQLQLGVSVDRVDATNELGGSKTQTNPKVGITWALTPATTLRAAAFRTLKRRFFANQTLEPTQVAGFNQFYDDFNATDAKRYGVALDHRFSGRLFAGAEASRRDLTVPQDFTENETFDWHEREAFAYVYWAPHDRVAVSARYRHERFERPPELPGQELFTEVTTRTLPLQIDFHHPGGLLARLTATYVRQSGTFYTTSGNPEQPEAGSDRFWVADLAIGYRLPGRLGVITAEAKNLFDETFRYQETDLYTPAFARRRVIFLRAALSF